MNNILYSYHYEKLYIDNNIEKYITYNLVDRVKKLYFNYCKKINNKLYIVKVFQITNKKYKIKEKINNIKTSKIITYSKLLRIINSTDKLNFVLQYINKKNNNIILNKYISIIINNNKITNYYNKIVKKIKNGKTIITTILSQNTNSNDIFFN